ncbi:MAG: type II toxin-antitoxin system PemK/MazF family toxin [Deltaproteobacteria bacterium]|nr:MAG: type II toxin-antitoxin system PemK/MazF family toxin [Deltaproteobacteria bacterium]
MTPRYGHLYVADLNPRFGTEPGKIRPVVVVQTDALNRSHPSTIVCPLTTEIAGFENPLRVALPKGVSGLKRASDVLVDQVKSIDNRRLRRGLGVLPDPYLGELRHKLLLILDFLEETLSTRPA